MAKEAEKPAHEAEHHKGGRSKSAKAANGSKEAGENESEIVQSMRARRQELGATLEKRNQNGDVVTVVREFAMAWIPHDDVEFELLYPAMVSGGVEVDSLAEALVRHDIINLLLADLLEQPDQDLARAKFEILAAEYAALQAMEERSGDMSERVEAASKASPDLLDEVKDRHEARKGRLARAGENFAGAWGALTPRSLTLRSMSPQSRRETGMQRNDMQRYQGYRDRDEHGRFLPEEERGGRGYERESRGRYEEPRGRYGDEERHEQRARSRYDDDRYRGPEDDMRERGRSGWHGDPEGHSEASRRAWRSERHGESGWFGDPEGHSEASRRGWRSGHHAESGWFGDSEGHSQASRRGWEEREGDYRRGEGGVYRSRGREEDERYRGREDDERGRSHGGWFGDSEAHSQASRRGWEEREGGYRSRERDDDRDRRRSRYDH